MVKTKRHRFDICTYSKRWMVCVVRRIGHGRIHFDSDIKLVGEIMTDYEKLSGGLSI